jgi:hypothetical protein
MNTMLTRLGSSLTKALPALVLLFVLFAAGAYAGTFTEPTGSPTGGNVTAPLNAGSVTQVKAGGLWADSIGSTKGFTFGSNSGWFATSSKNTVVAQQYCIGTDINNLNNDSCVTSFTGGGGSGDCKMERILVTHIPRGSGGYAWPILNSCADDLTNGIAGLKASDGWVATGEDVCAEYGGDGDNCNGAGHGSNFQCDYIRLVCNGTPVDTSSEVRDY